MGTGGGEDAPKHDWLPSFAHVGTLRSSFFHPFAKTYRVCDGLTSRFVDFIYIVAPISLVLLNPIAFGLMEYNARRNVGSPCSIKVSSSDEGEARLVQGQRMLTLCAGSVFDTVEGREEPCGVLHFFWHRGGCRVECSEFGIGETVSLLLECRIVVFQQPCCCSYRIVALVRSTTYCTWPACCPSCHWWLPILAACSPRCVGLR